MLPFSPLTMMGNPDAARAMVAAFLCDPDAQAGLLNAASGFLDSLLITELHCFADTDRDTMRQPSVIGAFALSDIAAPYQFLQTVAAHLLCELGVPFAVVFDADEQAFVPEAGAR